MTAGEVWEARQRGAAVTAVTDQRGPDEPRARPAKADGPTGWIGGAGEAYQRRSCTFAADGKALPALTSNPPSWIKSRTYGDLVLGTVRTDQTVQIQRIQAHGSATDSAKRRESGAPAQGGYWYQKRI